MTGQRKGQCPSSTVNQRALRQRFFSRGFATRIFGLRQKTGRPAADESPRRTRQKKFWYPGYVNYNQRSQWFKYLKKALVTKHNKISRLLLLSSQPFPKLNCYQSNTLKWILLTSDSVFFLNQVLENARRAVSETELPSLRTDSYHRSNTKMTIFKVNGLNMNPQCCFVYLT